VNPKNKAGAPERKLTRLFRMPFLNAVHFLEGVPLFAGLEEDHLTRLGSQSLLQVFPKGMAIFYQSDPANAAYIVRSGSVAIVLSSPDGRELVINEMRAGDCFGELSLLINQPRSTTAVARETSEILLIPRAVFLDVLENDPVLVRRLLQATAERLATSSERESALAFLDAPARLARILIHMDREESERGYITVSQEELAQRAGLTRQTVAKSLGYWRRAGWLVTGRGRIVLLDYQALGRISEQPAVEK
jgi:CRP/FNR family cyclic AMP-dependent transcriptional regulator